MTLTARVSETQALNLAVKLNAISGDAIGTLMMIVKVRK